MDIDDHGRLLNMMWIHPRSRKVYRDFHDVVCYDTTYLVNKHNMPLFMIVLRLSGSINTISLPS
ncbi:protein far1-related sequence 8 [Phtheirospermum japonicum]|uniref:Protein far1-related sequence 8 n=1 Tax=Phtheirospermum japonicum TaxID=374723 RepID=A0A830CCV3_9LAMI|nr:protein far1-related sequence 8 [Phtheirospermum japonicum]